MSGYKIINQSSYIFHILLNVLFQFSFAVPMSHQIFNIYILNPSTSTITFVEANLDLAFPKLAGANFISMSDYGG